MKVYFTASTAQLQKYRELYFGIRDHLIGKEHLLTKDWLPHTYERLKNGEREIRDIKEIYKACVKAIRDADAVIIEDTVSNFSTGHQITLALQLRKPTLVLWQGKKYREFKQMFIHGIDSDLLQVSEYQQEELYRVIDNFLNKYLDVKEKNRFHLVFSNVERSYLDWAQYNKGKSRTKLIRSALRKMIDSDAEYNDYLTRLGDTN